jgi:lipid-binding SYLF domain-containing protein
MKTNLFRNREMTSALLAVFLAGPALVHAQGFKKDPEKLDERIYKSTDYLVALQRNVQARIPAQILASARGIIILHQIKAGLGIGFQAGGGVASVRDPQSGAWSPPAFVSNVEGSYGFQIGGQKSDTVLLIMDDRGMELLKGGGAKIGVNLRATAGPSTAGGEFKVDSIKEPVLVYSDAGGLYAGAAIEGGGIGPNDKANAVYYGASMREVLFEGKGHWSEAGKAFIEKVIEYSRGAAVTPPVQGPPVTPPAQ